MKRVLLYSLAILSIVFSSCDGIIPMVMADADSIDLQIFIKDATGANLIEQHKLDDMKISATFKGEVYELKFADAKVYLPIFYGFKVASRGNGEFLYFGELDGTDNFNDNFVIHWGDGTMDVITIYNNCKIRSNGAYRIKRHYLVNGVKSDGNQITLIKNF